MTDLASEAHARKHEAGRRRSIGFGSLVIGCTISVAASVGLVLFLASPQARRLPGNPLANREVTSLPKFSVAMKTSRAGQDGEASDDRGDARFSSDIERALQPLRQALEKPQTSIARINALIALKGVLANYAAKTETYPSSQMALVPAAAALSLLRDDEFERNVPMSIINEMQYVSDGRSYKIIILGSGDCAVVHAIRPEMVDPKRSSGSLDCIAYGLWTPAGRDF